MGLVIIGYTDSFEVDLGGVSQDRKKARIRKSNIRSITESIDGYSVELVFGNGEIQSFPYIYVDSVDGDTDITTQDKLYNAVILLIFGA